ncbi:hypothetical protein Syun_021892 [Stephania yunnanensis]|uniref:Pentatricopeptide repeat-containing protein n=1 Tax=Stephania yunnanensis TaxID=152371 RepID=A0AAP0IH84_9MAGN
MIRGYSRCPSRDGIAVYARMRQQLFLPGDYDAPFALKCCATLKALFEGEQIHADVLKLGFEWNVFVQTALLDMYVKCSRIETAEQVFNNMRVKSVVSWTAMVAGYSKYGLLDKAKRLFHEMPIRNVVTWNALIDGQTRSGDVEAAQWYFNHMPQRNTVSWTIMISGYSKSGNVEKARMLFDRMNSREVVAWTVMISCYVENGEPGEAINFFREMLAADVKPDEVAMLALLSAAAQLRSMHLCSWVENCINECGFKSDIRILNAIISMYMECGSIDRAFDVFQKIPNKDVISYNSMITGCAAHGDPSNVFHLFSLMTRANIQPNSITFIGILTACAHRGLVAEGMSYFKLMLDLGYVELKSEHYACMVDLLGRAGELAEAYKLITEMPLKAKASTWGALLGACRIHGNVKLAEMVARKLFEIEPANPGNYAVLANMYAEKRMWDEAAIVRSAMEKKKVFKTHGSSWTEEDYCNKAL